MKGDVYYSEERKAACRERSRAYWDSPAGQEKRKQLSEKHRGQVYKTMYWPKNEPAKRSCLKCEKKFDSYNRFNRLCPDCLPVVTAMVQVFDVERF